MNRLGAKVTPFNHFGEHGAAFIREGIVANNAVVLQAIPITVVDRERVASGSEANGADVCGL